MGIFPDPQPTQEEITKQEVKELNAWIDGTFGITVERTKEMFDRFWNNPNATPQQISDVYGQNAAYLFQKLSIWQTALSEIDSSYTLLVVPDKWEYTINQDGTVTITEKV